jgi:hypothetical protein
MKWGVASSTPLDDFLAGGSSTTDSGELLQKIGLISSLGGLTIAFGVIVFLSSTHKGSAREIAVLLRFARWAGAATVIGCAIEVAGSASILGVG